MRCAVLACLVFTAATTRWEVVTAQQPSPTPTPQKFKCGKIITNYDKSLDKTTVQLVPRLIYGTVYLGPGTGLTSEPPRPTKTLGEPPENTGPARGLMMQVFFTFAGSSPVVPQNAAFLFTSQDTSPRYSSQRKLVAEIDGDKVEIGEMDLVQSRQEDYSFNHPLAGGKQYTKEVLGINVPFQIFERMSKAKKLRLKLNKTDIPFNTCSIESLQNLISQVKPL